MKYTGLRLKTFQTAIHASARMICRPVTTIGKTVFDEARAAGIRVALADGQVRLAASAPPPELLARLRERRIMAQAFLIPLS
jgi:hypothetical protein